MHITYLNIKYINLLYEHMIDRTKNKKINNKYNYIMITI